MTLAIRVHELVRDFRHVRALDHISFEVPQGIVFGFLGPNGAGKTTLIRVLLGLARPTSGQVEVLGLDPTRDGDGVRARTGALLEHNGLYERLTARQNLRFFARAAQMTSGEAEARIRALLTRFGLEDRGDEIVGTWSRGMKQRLAVARAVLHRPPLVFLDEPTAGLDPVASASLRDELARLATDEGVTVFLATHNLGEAERLCAEVGVVRRGRLVAIGSPASLRASRSDDTVRIVAAGGLVADVRAGLGTHPLVRHAVDDGDGVRITLADPGATPALVRWLVDQGVDVDEVRHERASFEATFLDLVDADRATA